MKIQEKQFGDLHSRILSNIQKTDDEYYWQHQKDLENSALNFQSLINGDTRHYSSPVAENESTRITDSESSPLVKPNAKTNTKMANPNFVFSEKNSLLGPESNSYLPQGQSENYAFNIQTNSSPLQNNSTLDKLSPKVSPNKPTLINLKNHQLFILNNEAEFSLNTIDLDYQQIKNLVQLLQKWLTNKGIRLQQLIINGVKQ
ncbi:hypothetical protein [Legionella micdadei]|uniref:Uncharacterized protein n=1 Tax=Legionella micdadei TaxID=451 RepID=A0A098GI11_LEGMI|nr:hypothetical protein [Legionella micdadei]ARG96958.1 hypothetical protein B6N58_04325 [Legionella micdadei]ARH00787.1 hypothetical protein B6V88_10375 [Legionella micdadei]KTD26668.1 hypothetical protein Lmic_2762 [Legionella micdadei]NSL19473.1 hypothetical protein [Legionella micdadei]CEG61635.1 protein of unknown function [Legionella micdadei]